MHVASTPMISTNPTPLAEFGYAIRGPHTLPHLTIIEATPVAAKTTKIEGGWDAAVSFAQTQASKSYNDGIHVLPINQAQGILQAADGAFSVVPLEGFHRDATGPLFVDGKFFDRTAHSLQIARRSAELVAVAGATKVIDLRESGFGLTGPSSPKG